VGFTATTLSRKELTALRREWSSVFGGRFFFNTTGKRRLLAHHGGQYEALIGAPAAMEYAAARAERKGTPKGIVATGAAELT
jgi:hypothetical protein